MLTIIIKSINAYKNHNTNPTQTCECLCDFFVLINQTNKHRAKIYDHCTYTQIIKKKQFHNYIKKFFQLPNIKINCFAEYKDEKFIIRGTKTNNTN